MRRTYIGFLSLRLESFGFPRCQMMSSLTTDEVVEAQAMDVMELDQGVAPGQLHLPFATSRDSDAFLEEISNPRDESSRSAQLGEHQLPAPPGTEKKK
jgi:hypothetical protein